MISDEILHRYAINKAIFGTDLAFFIKPFNSDREQINANTGEKGSK